MAESALLATILTPSFSSRDWMAFCSSEALVKVEARAAGVTRVTA